MLPGLAALLYLEKGNLLFFPPVPLLVSSTQQEPGECTQFHQVAAGQDALQG